ncbi:MAG TPA: NUDIX pyrophosphatase [Melioribacteraceae bacterium]|nr:NUDIX pyrophosphatase [Melioribacteraceae bacterium]
MKFEQSLIEAHIFRINNNDLEFLLLRRAETEKYPNIWQPITGTIDNNEKAYETAIREIYEETGIIVDDIYVVPTLSGYYSYEKDIISMIPVFAVSVNLNQKVNISEEHNCYRWVKYNEASTLVAWSDQRHSMALICERFSSKNGNLKFIKIKI